MHRNLIDGVIYEHKYALELTPGTVLEAGPDGVKFLSDSPIHVYGGTTHLKRKDVGLMVSDDRAHLCDMAPEQRDLAALAIKHAKGAYRYRPDGWTEYEVNELLVQLGRELSEGRR